MISTKRIKVKGYKQIKTQAHMLKGNKEEKGRDKMQEKRFFKSNYGKIKDNTKYKFKK